VELLTRPLAARYITAATSIPTSSQALADLHRRGRGPKFSILRGRAVYTKQGLEEWLAAELARTARERVA
jgi:hypothetical protein